MKLTYRNAATADHTWIAATWSTGWSRPHAASFVTPASWRTAVWASVPFLLARADVRAIVAFDADADAGDADLFGWLAWKPSGVECVTNPYTHRPVYRLAADGPLPLVFCCFVKHAARRSGIARGLFRAAGLDPAADFAYACRTRAADDLAGKIPRAVWCPDLGRLPQERTHGRSEEHDAA